jgi:hypothetical protein
MEAIEQSIKEKKPDISSSTLRTYKSILKNLYARNNEGKDMDVKWFSDEDKVLESLKDKAPAQRKTTLSALIAISKNAEKYRKLMNEDIEVYNQFTKTQQKTDKQTASWKDYEEVRKIYDEKYSTVKKILSSKDKIDITELMRLVDFMILSITTGIWFPPRRSQDWIYMKVSGYNPEEDNYLDMKNNQFVFNKYKTSKSYSTQKVEFPKDFKTILTKYLKHNPTEYLIFNRKNEPYTTQRLTQKLNSLFNGNISTTMLRHIFLTDKLKDIPKLTELNQLATDMGHSVLQQLEYIKR